MKTATVRELRNEFAKLEAWLAEGETIEIRKRGQPVARLTPPSGGGAVRKIKLPDWKGRRKAIWGDRVFTMDEVARMRAYELEGEEG